MSSAKSMRLVIDASVAKPPVSEDCEEKGVRPF